MLKDNFVRSDIGFTNTSGNVKAARVPFDKPNVFISIKQSMLAERWLKTTTPATFKRTFALVLLAQSHAKVYHSDELMSQRLPILMTLSVLAMSAATPDSVRYNIKFPAPQTHYAEVSADIPTGGQPSLELFMPVWTPGSYLVREYARNVESMSAKDGEGNSLPVEKSRKNRWRVGTNRAARVFVAYRIYCREMSVRTNWVDEDFALLNGAATYLTAMELLNHPYEVTLELLPAWKLSQSGLISGGSNRYVAPDYTTLVDSPIIAGSPASYPFLVSGKPHFLLNQGEGGVWDGQRSARDVETLVREYLRMWGSLPYDKYVFLNLITESGGGLEHKNSFVIMTSRYATRTRLGYLGFLDLVSHEYFHLWNVKRLRPVELGPFDYETEVYTKGLWISEGFTDYYGMLAVKRAGLCTRDEYLGIGSPTETVGSSLSRQIEELQTTPGRLAQPVEMASYDTWIKFYRPDENSKNTGISYYTKGAVIAWLLDAKIRKSTNGTKTLDHLMRLAYDRYSGGKGFTSAEFRKTASEVAGADLSGWFVETLDTTHELDYNEALDWFGLRFKKPEPPKNNVAAKSTLGAVTRTENGRLIVAQVPRDTAAFDAGFSAEDEILAIDGFRVRPEQWAQRMEQYHAGDKISVLVARRDRLVRLDATLRAEPDRLWQLEVLPTATPEQRQHLDTWLTPATAPSAIPTR